MEGKGQTVVEALIAYKGKEKKVFVHPDDPLNRFRIGGRKPSGMIQVGWTEQIARHYLKPSFKKKYQGELSQFDSQWKQYQSDKIRSDIEHRVSMWNNGERFEPGF